MSREAGGKMVSRLQMKATANELDGRIAGDIGRRSRFPSDKRLKRTEIRYRAQKV